MKTVDKRITELIEKYHQIDKKHKKIKDQRNELGSLLKEVLKERDNLIETVNYRASLSIKKTSRFEKDKLKKDYGIEFIEKYTNKDAGTRETIITEKRGA